MCGSICSQASIRFVVTENYSILSLRPHEVENAKKIIIIQRKWAKKFVDDIILHSGE